MLFAVLAGCATPAIQPAWPELAYPRQYFIQAYEQDEETRRYQTEDEYLLWVTRFYEGYQLAPGWLELTRRVLERLDEPEQSEVSKQLYNLGRRIGSEWAKDNNVRQLDTRNVSVWGDALIESLNQDDLDNYITKVEEDIDSLISGKLDKDDIYFERYYIDDFEF